MSDIFVVQTEPRYPDAVDGMDRDNSLSRALRGLWSAWGKDPANPFGDWVRPGGKVVIKPNWVMDNNPNGHSLDSLVTHTSLIRQVVEDAATALQGQGCIVIGDSPLQQCKFPNLLKGIRIEEALESVRQRYPNLRINVEDWRLTLIEGAVSIDNWTPDGGQSQRLDYDTLRAKGYELVDLGTNSFLEEIADFSSRFRVTCYPPELMGEHHRPGKHEYLVTNRIFDADLVVNLPKMKTHIKAGLTGALKNLVGINGHKEYLPHHVVGSYHEGGDCYCRPNRFSRMFDQLYDRYWGRVRTLSTVKRRAYGTALRLLWFASRATGGDGISAGSWSGNETIWRMTLDLNHILYGSERSARHILTLADGVIAGENEGPLRPTPKPAGLLIAAHNPAHVDAVMAKFMGYSIARVPTVYHALNHRCSRFAGASLDQLAITKVSAEGHPQRIAFADLPNLGFIKPRHWQRADSELYKTITRETNILAPV